MNNINPEFDFNRYIHCLNIDVVEMLKLKDHIQNNNIQPKCVEDVLTALKAIGSTLSCERYIKKITSKNKNIEKSLNTIKNALEGYNVK